MKKLAAAVCLLLSFLCGPRVFANGTVTVTTLNDAVNGTTTSIAALIANPGPDGISLREALLAANNTPSTQSAPNAIDLPAGLLTLTNGELVVGSSTNLYTIIQGQGYAATRIAGTSARVFDINPSLVANVRASIQSLTIAGGVAGTHGGGAILGGGVANQLTLNNCVILGNRTLSGFVGGGVCWSGGGDLIVTDCQFLTNTATAAVGGAICFDNGNGNPGNLTIANTLFAANLASHGPGAGQGGALFVSLDSGSVANINHCVFNDNATELPSSQGGGLYASSGIFTILDGQFSNNIANSGQDTFANSSATINFINDLPPQITSNPADQIRFIGTTATFAVSATDPNPITYQWLRNGSPLSDNDRIFGSATSTLTLLLVTPADQASYSVVVSNLVNGISSQPAGLTVNLVHPVFGQSRYLSDGPEVIFSGTAGAPDGQYTVLTATNVTTSLTNWTPLSTNYFGETGDFSFIDSIRPDEPTRFYLLRIP